MTCLTTGAVTGLIDRFEKKLVKRQFATDDRRKFIIKPITENITALLEPLYTEFRNKSEKLIGSFSTDEIKVLETYFSKAINILMYLRDHLMFRNPAFRKWQSQAVNFQQH